MGPASIWSRLLFEQIRYMLQCYVETLRQPLLVRVVNVSLGSGRHAHLFILRVRAN